MRERLVSGVDRTYIDAYSAMIGSDRIGVDSDDLKQLESRIDQLIEACQRLQNENQSLKSEHDSLHAERAKLLEKTRIARERIESMISRLKALERSE